MSGIKERRKRCDCMAISIKNLRLHGGILQKDMPSLIENRGFETSESTIKAVVGGRMISERSLSGIEPILDALCHKNKVSYAWCTGQLKPDGGVR